MGEEEMIKYIYKEVCIYKDSLERAKDMLITENKMLKQQNEMLIQILNKESK